MIEVQITSLNAHYRQPEFIGTLDWSADSSKARPEQYHPEIDPEHVMISFVMPQNTKLGDDGGSLLIKTADAKKLSLMIGDKLTIKLLKTRT